MQKKAIVITHSGNFHADEILSVATLDLLLKGEYELIRTRDPEIIKTGDYIVDVGGVYDSENNKFDHHQEEGAGKRKNGIPYSSFGLVWEKFGVDVCGSQEEAEIIDKTLGEYIDAQDNGIDTTKPLINIKQYRFANAIKAFSPMWREDRTDDEGFKEALSFAKRILEREILKAEGQIVAEKIAQEKYESAKDKRIIILDEYIPAKNTFAQHKEILYKVGPGKNEKDWVVVCIREEDGSFTARKPYPRSWWGKVDEEFAKVSSVKDAKFCHRSGNLICIAGSKNGAIKLAQLAADN